MGRGRPAGVVLLPPANIKVRAFVPEPQIGAVQVGDRAAVHVDGVAETFSGRITFVSPQAEYTPPVIYSRENRSKLVFLVEARPDQPNPALHPGLPVEVTLATPSAS